MTRVGTAARRLAVAVVASTVSATGLVAATATASDAVGESSLLRQQATIAWYGKNYQKHADASVVVPGIGTARIVCRRDRTDLTIKPYDRTKETQMWSAVYQPKTDGDGNTYSSVAVKNSRVYRYANADDDGTGGTGSTASEGFNQLNRIENSSTGYMRGVISQRPARNKPAAGVATPPSTQFYVTWDWSGYRGSSSKSRCNASAVFTTRIANQTKDAAKAIKAAKTSTVKLGGKKVRVGVTATKYRGLSAGLALNWHGDADAAQRTSSSFPLDGIGTLRLVCPAGTDSAARLTVKPEQPSADLYAETITGEGDVADHVDKANYGYDDETGLLAPLALPENGMVRGTLTVGSRKVNLIVSSYRKTNDDEHPELNLCEVAVAVSPG